MPPLKRIYHIHEVEDAAVIAIVLTRGVTAAIGPRGGVLDEGKPTAKIDGEIGKLEEASGFTGEPVAES